MEKFLSRNLKFLRKSRGLNLDDIPQVLDIARSTYNSYETGKAEPTLDTILKFSSFFGFGLDALVLQDLSNNPVQAVDEGLPIPQKPDRSLNGGIVLVDSTENSIVPILDIKAAAGSPTLLDEPDYLKALPIFSFPNFMFRGKLVGMHVRGESMTPTIKQGDYVVGRLLDNLQDLRNGEVHILIYQEDHSLRFTVKRCFHFMGDDVLTLESDNTDHPADNVPIASLLKIYHVQGNLTTRLERTEGPAMRRQLDRIERRIDRLERRG